MMPEMCVIYGSNTTRIVKEGIYIHAIPYLNEKKEIMGRICLQNTHELETCRPVTLVIFLRLFVLLRESPRERSCKLIAKKR